MSDGYDILVAQDVRDLIDQLDDKSARIVRENLQKLTNPYPSQGPGDQERIQWKGDEVFRLHIGRTWTAFYDIKESEQVVKVLAVMSIDQAHKRYGDLG